MIMLFNAPEIASGLTAWRTFLARLDAHPRPNDPQWAQARADAEDMIAWFESLPADHPARQLGGTAGR